MNQKPACLLLSEIHPAGRKQMLSPTMDQVNVAPKHTARTAGSTSGGLIVSEGTAPPWKA